MSEWISIEDRKLPDNEGTYLIANKKGQVCPIVRGIIQNNTGSCFDWQYGESITHWMPLPDAPK